MGPLAVDIPGRLLDTQPDAMGSVLDRWLIDDNLWLRRTAILAQLKRKARTDSTRLFRACRSRAHEREFFIRKAIGWALREYSKTDPQAVSAFVSSCGPANSGLSRREALKHIERQR